MNLWPSSSVARAAGPEPSQPVSSTSVRLHDQWQVRSKFRLCRRSDTPGGPPRLLCLKPVLAAVLLLVAATLSVRGQTSVTLAWDPDAGTNIAGYKIYYGVASRTYTNTTNVGNVTNATISGLIGGTIYYFAATAVDTSGLESDYSAEVVYTNPAATAPTIVQNSPVSGDSNKRSISSRKFVSRPKLGQVDNSGRCHLVRLFMLLSFLLIVSCNRVLSFGRARSCVIA